ncbi:MAG: fluoride efflux transporter CrcB [Gammaproteobacteria bacterium]|nr:fluoride efflux transporter CrcB [Gammaproteobacteria bacterium]
MSPVGLLLVGLGAALGAWSRWALSLALNSLYPALPLGTLAANLVGAYLMGLALGLIDNYGHLSPDIRLFLVTGFLGGLTTFSAFSGEMSLLVERQQWSTLGLGLIAHVAGSIALTLAGLATVARLKGAA